MNRRAIAAATLLVALTVACKRAPPAGPPPNDLVTVAPSGEVSRVDQFQWTTRLAPASYRVTVLDAGARVVLSRETTEQRIVLDSAEIGAMVPGGYSWAVEARDANGEVMATSRWQLFDVN